MSFPAGPLPNVPFLQDLIAAGIPSKSVAFTHGGSDLDLTDPTNGLNPCAIAFYANTAGNLVARLAGDSSDQTFAVAAKQMLFGAFIKIASTSTCDGIVLGRH